MKLNASKAKTMIVTRSRTMHPGTVLKASDDLVVLGVTFDSKVIPLRRIFARFPEQRFKDLVS